MNKLAEILGIKKRAMTYLVLMLLLIIFLTTSISSVQWFVEFSSLPIGITKSFIGIVALALIDDVVFGEINTFREIHKGNIAYALIYLANAIIIAASLAWV